MEKELLDNVSSEATSPFLHMPPDLWPNVTQPVPTTETMDRRIFWPSAMLLMSVVGVAVGTMIMKAPEAMFRLFWWKQNTYDPLIVATESEDKAGFERMTTILCVVSCLAHLTLTTKVSVTCALSNTLASNFGFPYEGYATILSAGLTWMLAQAIAIKCLYPGRRIGIGVFATCFVTTCAPITSAGFDTVKDAMFAGIALSGSTIFSMAIGIMAYMLLWGIHIYMIRDGELRQELKAVYVNILEAVPEKASEKDAHAAAELESVGLAAGFMVKVFRQTTPEKRKALMLEDGPQGALAVLYSATQGFSTLVLVLNVAIPLLRYFVIWSLYPVLRETLEVQSWLLQEADVAEENGLDMKASSLRSHFSASTFLQMVAFKKGSFPPDRTQEFIRELPEVLKDSRTLRVLQLLGLKLGDATTKAIMHALASNTSVEVLDLSSNGITEDAREAIAETLKQNRTLKKLNLSWNRLRDVGAEAIMQALKSNTTLEELDLSRIDIKDGATEAIVGCLKDNRTLKRLFLSDGKLGDTGAQAIMQALESNTSLEVLDLGMNEITEGAKEAVCEALKENRAAKVLNLSYNKLCDGGVQAIMQALKSNTSLEVLNLYRTSVTEGAKEAIIDALKENTSLIELKLYYHVFTKAAREELTSTFKGRVIFEGADDLYRAGEY
eukprot:TRINITY_DN5215_c0_g5_i1.p1 TRINITY_DN5215_c0_g5~~TRINITY_DN5215_c0_g5_i1.p1  ORF type:complete len:746 (+),score=128.48 TRINITY_DN5215_c0_g5_i1:240-2240(+)